MVLVTGVLTTAGTVLVSALTAWLLTRSSTFVEQACHNVETYLPSQVVGQELAISQLTDAVCHHVTKDTAAKPLVVSVHGPPGVGKTLTHQLLAKALYSRKPSPQLQCPGKDCMGYKVLYGMDYLATEREARLASVRDALLSHLHAAPDALVVVEEYDKLSCETRGMFRQLLQHPELANVTWNRAIVLLESNLGMSELEQMLSDVKDRSKITAEMAERRLRDTVFSRWRLAACESYEDTLKLVSLVDFFLPFLPLERRHVRELMARELAARGQALLHRTKVALAWDEGVVDFLTDKIEFDEGLPLEGAKGVDAVATRYTGKLLRRVHKAREANTTLVLQVEGEALSASMVPNTQLQAQQQTRDTHVATEGAGARAAAHTEAAGPSDSKAGLTNNQGVESKGQPHGGHQQNDNSCVGVRAPSGLAHGAEGACEARDAASSCAG